MRADLQRSLGLLALVLLALALALGAPAYAGQFPWVGPIVQDPFLPDDTHPTAVHIVGSWPGPSNPIAVQSVEIDEVSRSIVVDIAGSQCVISCAEGDDYAVTAELGVLSSGNWNVDVRVVYGSSPPELEKTISLFVRQGFDLRSLQIQPTSDEPVALLVESPVPCPEPFLESIEDGVATLRFERGEPCVIGVPGTTYFAELQVGLPAGPHRLELRETEAFGGYLLDRLEIDVVEVPIRLGPGDRYEVSVIWTDFQGTRGDGRPASPPSDDSALFWFFGAKNWELMIKVLDACDLNDHVWVFGAATTTVGYELRVVDTATGAEWSYENPLGQASDAITDVEAFDCD